MSDETIILSGYFVPMSAARDLATDLGLNVGEDTPLINARLQSVFNGWLAENNKSHILAAAITWPRRLNSDAGIIFISKFGKGQLENVLEDGEALEVKNDMERWSQTLKFPLQWITIADRTGITRWWTCPRPNPPVWVKGTFAEMMERSRHNRSLRGIGSYAVMSPTSHDGKTAAD